MGYSTRYTLTLKPPNDEIVATIRAENDEIDTSLDGDEPRWYEHEEDMLAISKRWPETMFTLKGEGEESGDIWIKHFKDGKIQRRPAEMVFPPFREDGWEDK